MIVGRFTFELVRFARKSGCVMVMLVDLFGVLSSIAIERKCVVLV